MKLVLVFGTFDILHPGHLFFLKEAKKRGDKLIASVARDSFVAGMKKQVPIHNEQERMAYLKASGLVDEVYLSDVVPGTYQLILSKKPQLICLGYDQLQLKENLTHWLTEHKLFIPIEIIGSFEPDKYKSSKIKQELFVAIDIKTTGSRPETHQLLELGAVLFNREKELSAFHAFIEPSAEDVKPEEVAPLPGTKQPTPFVPLGEALPAFVRFCREAYPVTRRAFFSYAFLLYNLSRLPVDALHLANLSFDVEQLADKSHPEKVVPAHEVFAGNNLSEASPFRSTLEIARSYQASFCHYLSSSRESALPHSLLTHDFVSTAEGLALTLNWQALLRHLSLPLLEESLFEHKPVRIDYFYNGQLTPHLIRPLGISLEEDRLILLAYQAGQSEGKPAHFYLNRIKMP